MIEFLSHNMAPLMFVALVIFLLIGYPVAFSLAAIGIFFGLGGIELGLLHPTLFQALPQRIWAVMSNDTLLAVPFFSFMVLIIMADQLGRSVGDMYEGAFIPGLTLAGLYAVYALAITLVKPAWAPALPLEARTLREPDGSSGTRSLVVLVLVATAAAIGFAKYKYGPDGPTDEMLVVSTAVGVGVAFAASVINHFAKLGLLSRIAERVTFVLIPPLALIFLVLGTIFLGVATPTEGGAMGASGALAMALARRRLSVKLLKQAMDTTAKLTAFVVFILVGARVFSLTFYGVDGHLWVESLLT